MEEKAMLKPKDDEMVNILEDGEMEHFGKRDNRAHGFG